MTSLMMLGVLLAADLASDAKALERHRRDVCEQYSNGCSVPGNLPFFYKTTFTPSCDRHDICYNCGAMLSYTKSECDTYFLNSMLKACASLRRRRDALSRKYRDTCTTTAQMYYQVLRVAGASSYHSAGTTESYCYLSLIFSCVP